MYKEDLISYFENFCDLVEEDRLTWKQGAIPFLIGGVIGLLLNMAGIL